MNELKKHNDKIGLFRRSDGTLFCLRTNGKVTINSVTHSYMDFEKKDDGMYINASAIISDVNLLEINTFIVQKTADILLSKKRVEDKINKYNGYVGYPEYENGEFKKYVSSSLEETIAGITRESA